MVGMICKSYGRSVSWYRLLVNGRNDLLALWVVCKMVWMTCKW